MKSFATTLRIGIGDIILAWAALENMKHKLNDIYIDVNWSILSAYKDNSENYKKFIQDLIQTLFTDNKYKLFTNKRGEEHTFDDFRNYGIPAVLPKAAHLLCADYTLMDAEYIVITTKVRQFDKKKFLSYKDHFIEIIKKLSIKYKIVLLGEQEIEYGVEYSLYGVNHIYSLYDYLKDINNVIDLTTKVISSDNASLENVKKDCAIMHKARAVITVGCGGNLTLAAAVSKHLIGIRRDDYEFGDFIYRNPNDEIYVVRDHALWLDKIEKL